MPNISLAFILRNSVGWSEAKPAKANDWRSGWNLFKVSKAKLKKWAARNFKRADFTLQEDPFCTKSKILAKGGVARRAKPAVRRVRSFSEVGSPEKSWLNVKFFWGRQSQKRSFCVPFSKINKNFWNLKVGWGRNLQPTSLKLKKAFLKKERQKWKDN